MAAPVSSSEVSPLLPTRIPNDIRPDRNEGVFLAEIKQAKADQTPSPGPADASSKKNDTKTTSGTKDAATPSESKDGATSSNSAALPNFTDQVGRDLGAYLAKRALQHSTNSTSSGQEQSGSPAQSTQGDTKAAQDKPAKADDQKPAAFTVDISFKHGSSAPQGGSPAPNGGSSASKGGSTAANGGSSASKGGSSDELQVDVKGNLLKNVKFTGSGTFTFPTNGKPASQVNVGFEVPHAKFGVQEKGHKVTGTVEGKLSDRVTLGGQVTNDGSYEGHLRLDLSRKKP